MVGDPYGAHAHHQYTAYMSAPPSPPVEEATKCSLPSISSLLGMTDDGSSQTQQQQQQQQQQPQPQQIQQPQSQQPVEYRSSTGHGGLPPTPPMQSDTAFDGRQSPSTSSQYSVVSAPQQTSFYYPSTINNVDTLAQRQNVTIPRRVSYSGYNNYTPRVSSSYYSPMTTQSSPQVSGLYYQRSLPQVRFQTFLIEKNHMILTPHSNSCQEVYQEECPSPPMPTQTHGNTTTTSPPHQPHHSPNPKTATSARPATRPSAAPAPSASTHIVTRAKSPSNVLTPAAAKPSALEAT